MADAMLVATLDAPRPAAEAQLRLLPEAVAIVEVRADRVGDPDPRALRAVFAGRLLYTFPPPASGAASEERARRLGRAATAYDLVTLGAPHDLVPDVLRAVPPEKRLLSWRGAPGTAAALRQAFEEMVAVEARYYRLAVEARQASDGLALLQLLQTLGRPDVLAYAEGPSGLWTRLLAPRLGAPLVFGSLSETPPVPGTPTLSQLIQDYGLPALPPLEGLYGIVGDPVAHSLSPRMHNAAYRQCGLKALYLPFQTASFEDFWRAFVEPQALARLGWPLRGLTVVSPFKEVVGQVTVKQGPETARALSSNLFFRNNGAWHADTTDPAGVLAPLQQRGIDVEGLPVAIIGCGGSGRAIAAALDAAGASVTLVNRSRRRGEKAHRMLGLPYVPLASFSAEGYALVVNATPVGREDGALPFPAETLAPEAVVVDLVYGAYPTPLVAQARARGQAVVEGREVLLVQVRRQFELMTGRAMPEALARAVIGFTAAAPVTS